VFETITKPPVASFATTFVSIRPSSIPSNKPTRSAVGSNFGLVSTGLRVSVRFDPAKLSADTVRKKPRIPVASKAW
jgi:hypothetical protein